jgi:glycosyltransferase involved in cell wall biosynthesis
MYESNEFPLVSVVICTFNRKRLLKDCLNSVLKMDYPKSLYEIIVVDGGSRDGTEELCKRFPRIKFIIEKRLGLARARNKGAEVASGSIIAYTDDDCIVDKQWLMQLVCGFKSFKSVVGVGGVVCPLISEIIPDKILVKPALGLVDDGEKIKLTPCLIGANFAFRKEIFETRRFDVNLGRSNATTRHKLLLSGEDVDFCQTLIAAGHQLLYTPYAKVYHQISINRVRVTYILKHAIQGGISQARILVKKRTSRIWAFRYAVGGVVQAIFPIFSDRSFTSCYELVTSLSTLFVCLTGLDTVL